MEERIMGDIRSELAKKAEQTQENTKLTKSKRKTQTCAEWRSLHRQC